MTTQNEAVKWASDRLGQRVDVDGVYGSQCMDFIVQYCKDFWGWHPSGNAIDLWYQALPAGFQRIANTPDFLPQVGDIFVKNVNGHNYGHTGIITSATLTSFVAIEQNGNPATASLANGSPAERINHNYVGFLGVIRPPFTDSSATQTPSENWTRFADPDGDNTAYFNIKLPVSDVPTDASPAVAYYEAGQKVYYDSQCVNDGFVWISYISTSGTRRYIAICPYVNGSPVIKNWVSFGKE